MATRVRLRTNPTSATVRGRGPRGKWGWPPRSPSGRYAAARGQTRTGNRLCRTEPPLRHEVARPLGARACPVGILVVHRDDEDRAAEASSPRLLEQREATRATERQVERHETEATRPPRLARRGHIRRFAHLAERRQSAELRHEAEAKDGVVVDDERSKTRFHVAGSPRGQGARPPPTSPRPSSAGRPRATRSVNGSNVPQVRTSHPGWHAKAAWRCDAARGAGEDGVSVLGGRPVAQGVLTGSGVPEDGGGRAGASGASGSGVAGSSPSASSGASGAVLSAG